MKPLLKNKTTTTKKNTQRIGLGELGSPV